MPLIPVDPTDRALATELLARYAEAVDAGDFDAVGALLADATIEDADGNEIPEGDPRRKPTFRFDHGDARAHATADAWRVFRPPIRKRVEDGRDHPIGDFRRGGVTRWDDGAMRQCEEQLSTNRCARERDPRIDLPLLRWL